MVKVISNAEIVSMSRYQYRNFILCMEAQSYRFLGFFWKKYIKVTWDSETLNFIFEYE